MQTERRPEGVADTLARVRSERSAASRDTTEGYGFTLAGFLIGIAALLANLAGVI